MRQVHQAGEKVFVDYAGMKPQIVDALTGEIIEVELFVAVLGASQLHLRGGDPDAAGAGLRRERTRALTFLGGVPGDRARSAQERRHRRAATSRACSARRRAGRTLRHHHPAGATEIARDKAKVEVGVQVAERWLLARIATRRSRASVRSTHGSPTSRRSQRAHDARYKASRRELFERLDKPAAHAVAAEPFEASTWKKARSTSITTSSSTPLLLGAAPAPARDARVRPGTTTVEIFHAALASRRTSGATFTGATRRGRAHAEQRTGRIAEWTSIAHSRLGRSGRPTHAHALRGHPA